MTSRSRAVIAILVVLRVAALISSRRVHHTLVRGSERPRAVARGRTTSAS